MKWLRAKRAPATGSQPAAALVEVIIYAHAPADALHACLESALLSFSGRDFIVVNDAKADNDVSSCLEQFKSAHGSVVIENFDRLGYWRSVTKAIDRSYAEYLVILDSSAVATRNSLRELVESLYLDESIDVVVPLTSQHLLANLLKIDNSDSAFAELVADANPELVATVLENSALFGESTCALSAFSGYAGFAVRRSASEKLAAWRYVSDVGDSRSEPLRISLAAGYYAAGCSPVPGAMIAPLWDALASPSLSEAFEDFYRIASAAASLEHALSRTALFVLPNSVENSDGDDSVPLEIMGLRDCGMRAQAAIGSAGWRRMAHHFPHAPNFWIVCEDDDEMVKVAARYDIVIATDYQSSKILMEARRKTPEMIAMYYLQDYEPWSLPDEPRQLEAERTYAEAMDVRFFARSNWLCRTMLHRHGIKAAKVAPGIDRALYDGFSSACRDDSEPVTIVSPIRPAAPSGNAGIALRILGKIASKHGAKVDIRVFGCTEEQLDEMAEAQGFRFKSLSILKSHQVADVLRGADIFADLSARQAVGQMGLEAMAAGCAAILPCEGGVPEFARDGENCLVVDTTNEAEVLAAFDRLIAARRTIGRLKTEGIRTGRCNSIRRTVWSELLLFSESAGRADVQANHQTA